VKAVIQRLRAEIRSDRNAWLAFRHFFRHAYAVSLEAPRLEALRTDMLALRAPLEQDLDALDGHLARVAAEPG